MPPGRSTRWTSSRNSVVVRCHGTARPPNASPTTRSNAVVGQSLDGPPRIADHDLDPGARREPELLARDPQHDRVELEDRLSRARPRRLEIAREREAAATDVEHVDRAGRARPGTDRRHRRTAAHSRTRCRSGRPGRHARGSAGPGRGSGRRRRWDRARPRCSSTRSRCRTGTEPASPSAPVEIAARAMHPGRARPPPRRSQAVSTSPIATSSAPITTIRTRVGTRPSSTNPVRNVPVMAPAVPIADNRPTIEPLVARSVSVARTSIGPDGGQDRGRRHEGRGREAHDREEPVTQAVHRDRPERPHDGDRGDGREAAEHERRPQQRQRPDTRPRHGRPATPRARYPPGSRR